MYICSKLVARFKKMMEKSVEDEALVSDASIRRKVSSSKAAIVPRVSLQVQRSERTRNALLTAAEKIFARDGFEASRIEDIASEAGRSRGAFYANFDNKTEVFLALRTRAMQSRAREIRGRLTAAVDEDARIAAVQRHIIEQICDRQTLLLQIEFKLFALRHPELLKELADKHIAASVMVHEEELAEFFPNKHDSAETRGKTLAIEALLEGFALNALFSPRDLTLAWLEALLPGLLNVVLGLDGSPDETQKVSDEDAAAVTA
jgi:AcrR family transcriptional regulator